mgnify:CR=1 FL=1
MLDIIKAYAVNNLCYRAGKKMTPKGIVVHSTGANNPNLKRYVDCPDEVGVNRYGNHWNQPTPGGSKVCVHAFIGLDKSGQVRVAEILPLDICCWGVGKGAKGSYNYDPAYIQFEICEDALSDIVYFDSAFGVAAQYCAELCERYAIDVKNIVGHCEAARLGYGSNHSDPEHWMRRFGRDMDSFRTAVSQLLKIEPNHSGNGKFHDGDLVSLRSGAHYYNGAAVPAWVIKQRWYVRGEPSGDRVVIDENEAGTNHICSPVSADFLTLETPKSCRFIVRIKPDSLDIRKAPDLSSEKVGCIIGRGAYTIVEEACDSLGEKWGKLKSGAGWISLALTERVD